MIVSVINQKGGAGKTTLALNLAGALHKAGKKILIADTDPQGSIVQWQAINPAPVFEVRHILKPMRLKTAVNLQKGFDFLIIDSPPALEKTTVQNLMVSDMTIIPVSPSPLDIWSVNDTVALVKKIMKKNRKLKAGLLIYRKIPGTKIGKEVREALEAYGFMVFNTEITQKIAAVESINAGVTVIQSAPGSKSAAEFIKLATEMI